MNERIKELVEQTGYILDSDKLKTGMPVEDEFVEKFSELIVKEACQHLTNTGQDYARELVEKHFGVK